MWKMLIPDHRDPDLGQLITIRSARVSAEVRLAALLEVLAVVKETGKLWADARGFLVAGVRSISRAMKL